MIFSLFPFGNASFLSTLALLLLRSHWNIRREAILSSFLSFSSGKTRVPSPKSQCANPASQHSAL